MKKRWKKTAAAVFMIIALVCLTGVFLIRDSAENLELTHYTAENAGLPESFAGFKIVQLSDFHGAEFVDDIVTLVKAEKPDIIALTGDFITDGGDLPAVRELAQRLTDICDVYFVSGNHDFASGKIDELSDILKACGVKYLRNEYVVLEHRGERIVLAGVEDPNSWADLEPPEEFIGRLRAEFPDDYVALLGHRNYWMEKYPELPVQLILCGHAHGGIVRIPGIGGLLGTDRTLFPDYEAGKYDNGRYTMIVSRGIGNSVALPRFFNRPEIVGVVLKN